MIKYFRKKILIAVSGGVDSMVLLHSMRSKASHLVVAHVNYHLRKESDQDELAVQKFCKKHLIIFEKHDAHFDIKKGNLQKWAREERYLFFQKLYKKYDCKILLTAHHNDDFLETAEMQIASKRTPHFFGIKKHNNLYEMEIKRPFINLYWKSDLYKIAKRKNIFFLEDVSNQSEDYSRNKIRAQIAKWDFKEKRSRLQWYRMSNRILKKKQNKIEFIYKNWKKQEFSIKFFKNSVFKIELIYQFIHNNFVDTKLSKEKMHSISDFILAEKGVSKYIVAKDQFIEKSNGFIRSIASKK